MKTKKLSPTLGLWAVIVGSFFLISPMFAVVDILPDFIGYAFILFGVSKLADMNDKIEASAKLFRRLVILGVVRLVAILVVYGMASPTEKPTLQLLTSFVRAILDVMTLVPAWKNLSGGLLYLSTRHGGQAVFDMAYPAKPKKPKKVKSSKKAKQKPPKKVKPKTKTLLDKLTKSTLVYLVVREALSTLPEFAVLSSTQGGADTATLTSLYDYIGFMRQMCSIIVVVWGVVWLVRFVRFALHLGKDKVFFDAMTAKYQTEVLTRPELFARRGVKRAMVFMCIGVVFSVDFFLSELYTSPICVTPDFLMGILLLVGLLLIRKYVKGSRWTPCVVATVGYTLLTAVEFVLQIAYINMTDLRWAYHDGLFYERWQHMIVVRVITALSFVALLLWLISLLGDVIEKYTGFSVTGHDSANPSQRVKELHRELKRRLYVVLGVGIAVAVVSVLYIATLPLVSSAIWWEFVGVIDVILPMIYAVVFIHATMQIFEQIDYKYMLS